MLTETAISIPATDDYQLGATLFAPASGSEPAQVVIVNCATGVKANYYARYARFLAMHGVAVITYDYRGIGLSRPANIRKCVASKYDWGSKDFEGVLRWANRRYPVQTIAVVGHSIGGVLPGFAQSNKAIARLMTIGSQYAYWKDYAARDRLKMYIKWHVLMPALTALVGYFPGRRLGWLEDLPAGVAFEWAFRRSHLESEQFLERCWHPDRSAPDERVRYFTTLTCPILAYGLTDDPYGTADAIKRWLNYCKNSPRAYVEISPQALQLPAIGHFAYFHDRFKDNLWPESLAWLAQGKVTRPVTTLMPAASSMLEQQ